MKLFRVEDKGVTFSLCLLGVLTTCIQPTVSAKEHAQFEKRLVGYPELVSPKVWIPKKDFYLAKQLLNSQIRTYKIKATKQYEKMNQTSGTALPYPPIPWHIAIDVEGKEDSSHPDSLILDNNQAMALAEALHELADKSMKKIDYAEAAKLYEAAIMIIKDTGRNAVELENYKTDYDTCLKKLETAESDKNACDAFAMSTVGLPVQINPKSREFLKNIAIALRKSWNMSPNAQSSTAVLAVYRKGNREPWQFFGSPHPSNDATQLAALKLVKEKIAGTIPPMNEPFGILFRFDSYRPDSASIATKTVSSDHSKPDVDFGPYMALLQTQVRSNWTLRRDPGKHVKAVMQFRIKPDGMIEGVKVTNGSGIRDYDSQAVEAITKSAPFLPPPGSEMIDIQDTFDYQPAPKSRTKTDKLFTVTLEHSIPITIDAVNLSSLVAKYQKQ